MTREDLMALTPDHYLAGGFIGPDGEPRRALLADWATAASTQLMAAGLSPQEMSFSYEATRLLLPVHDEAGPGDRLRASVAEALMTVGRGIQQRNNEGLVQWLDTCASHVSTEGDAAAFMAHWAAVTRQYALLVALQPSAAPS